MEQFEHLEETQLSSEAKYDGTLLHIRRDTVRLPDGKTATREYNIHNGAVCIIPLLENGEVLLERQYRYPLREVITEIPAGKLDAPDEDPLEAAQRELREETGAVAEHYIDLGKFYPTPGYCGEIIHMYAANGLSFTSLDLDDDEFLAPEKIPLEKAVEMVMNNEIRDGKTQAAVLKVAQKRRKGEI